MLQTFVSILQGIVALGLVVLMAIQTDKAEQGGGGVMGLGAAGGRTSGTIDMAVGAERILKPLTRWCAVGFLFLSVLAAMPGTATIYHLLVTVILYLFLMLHGGRLWQAVTGTRR